MVKKEEYARTVAYVLDAFANADVFIDERINRIPEMEA